MLPLPEFLKSQASAGLVLMAAAGFALIAANSALAPDYFQWLHTPLAGLDLLHWVNDGLMAVFFLLVGLEIKREMIEGQLSTWPQRVLPGFAAVGGMVVPALIYVVINRGEPVFLRGWAIPMATDIAFALGVLALLGSRVPTSLKVFLTALAITDDLGAVIVIALFYTTELSFTALGLSAGLLAVLIVLNRAGVMRLWIYLLLGVALWACVLKSGIHATLAGVMLALTLPVSGTGAADSASPLHRLEHGLHPWVAFLVIPVFGFTNAGVALGGMTFDSLLEPVPLGIICGLFIGKQIGVFGFAWLAVRSGYAQLPELSNWRQLYGIAMLCGIGFTMSLFIGALAFSSAPELGDATKIGVLAGSLVSALAGSLLLWPKR
jgi:NhaA family Na+:H+ antiporter